MNVNTESLQKALDLQKQIEALQAQQIALLSGQTPNIEPADPAPVNGTVTRSRKFSPEGLEMIRQAQLRRWRRVRKAEKAAKHSVTPVVNAPAAPVAPVPVTA
jgi:hypothetical protein